MRRPSRFLMMIVITCVAMTLVTAAPASAAVVRLDHATWAGTIQADEWITVTDENGNLVQCPGQVTMRGTITAPVIGRADVTMSFSICGGGNVGNSFDLANQTGTIGGQAFFAGRPFPDGLPYGAMCNFGSGTGRFARLIWPAEDCSQGGSIIALAIVGLQPGVTDPVPASGPVNGNLTF